MKNNIKFIALITFAINSQLIVASDSDEERYDAALLAEIATQLAAASSSTDRTIAILEDKLANAEKRATVTKVEETPADARTWLTAYTPSLPTTRKAVIATGVIAAAAAAITYNRSDTNLIRTIFKKK